MASFLETSRLYQAAMAASDRIVSVVRGSYLYRWLTAEPDPEVIVIDLRDTWTVGQVILLLDRVFGHLERAATGSALVKGFERLYARTLAAPLQVAGRGLFAAAVVVGVAGAVSRSIVGLAAAVGCVLGGLVAIQDERSWAEFKETRAVELLIAAFEPPAPPEAEGLQDGETTDDGEGAEPETDEPEGNPLDESHQGVDRDVPDDGARGERNDRRQR